MPQEQPAQAPAEAVYTNPFEPLADTLKTAALLLVDQGMRLYSLQQVAEFTGRSLRAIKTEVAEGRLRVTHAFGPRSQRVEHAELKRYIDAHRLDVVSAA